jgi:cytoskeletal protein CcmA (bactofilin family)
MPRSAAKPQDPARHVAPASIISNGLRITGDLKSTGHVHIDGILKGNLEADSVVVGKKGSIEGNVAADTIEVLGFVSGNINARFVEFRATAHIVGDTTHEELRVEKGACLDGNFKMRATTEPAPAKASV